MVFPIIFCVSALYFIVKEFAISNTSMPKFSCKKELSKQTRTPITSLKSIRTSQTEDYLTEISKEAEVKLTTTDFHLFKTVITFLFHDGYTEQECYESLVRVYDTLVPEAVTIRSWHRLLREKNSLMILNKRPGRPRDQKLNKQIEKILADDSGISASRIVAMLQVSVSTVIERLKKDFLMRLVKVKWIPHHLPQSVKDQRVENAKEMLLILSSCEKTNYRNLFTMDESWIYLDYSIDKQWIPIGYERPTAVKPSISSRKCLLTIVFSGEKIWHISLLEEEETMDSKTFVDSVLSPMQTLLSGCDDLGSPIYFHMDNASSHRSHLTDSMLDEMEVERMPQPPYSPDISPSDFFMFGFLKRKLAGKRHESRNKLEITLQGILKQVDSAMLRRAFKNWEKRLKQVITNGGNYYDVNLRKKIAPFQFTFPEHLPTEEESCRKI
jgi:histone-lysine N-methyltransferase SETMAR